MNKSQIKRALRREAERVEVPDVLESVLNESGCDLKPPAAVQKSSKARRPLLWGLSGALVCAVLILAVALPIIMGRNSLPPVDMPAFATVCLRINPSVELKVKEGKVTGARALNKDAAVLLLEVNLTGMGAAEACLYLADAASRTGYMTGGGVTLLVSGKDEKTLSENITAGLAGKYAVNSPSLGDVDERAAAYGITAGKMSLIDEVMNKVAGLSEKKLVKMDAEDLLELLEDYDEAAMEAYENQLRQEYGQQFTAFLTEVRTTLESYKSSLNGFIADLAGLDKQQIISRVNAVNKEFEKLGKDFRLPKYDGDDDYAEELEDLIAEADETLKDIAEDVDEVFEDWYEEFLDGFKQKGNDAEDDNDNDDDESDEDDGE